MPQALGIPLQDILAHPGLKHVKVVAGARGLNRLVKYVNVMEVPDILDWVKEGELLLTTVYAIRHDTGAQSRLIPELAAKKLAGLAIKPGRYIEKIPDIMLAQAEELGLPLLEIPFAASFSDIIIPIISEILNKQASILQQADTVHARLSQVVLEGGDLPEIAAALAELLDENLVMIENCLGEAVAMAPAFRAGAFPACPAILPACGDPASLCGTFRGTVSAGGKDVAYVRTPVCAGKKVYGAITVFEVSRKISSRDEITVERAATVAAVAMANHLAVNAVERRYYNEFINEMLVAGPAEEKNLLQRGKRLGINLGRDHGVAVIHITNPDPGTEQNGARDDEETKMLVLQQVVNALRDKFPGVAVGYKYDSMVLFVPEPASARESPNGGYKHRVRKIADYVREKVRIMYPQAQVRVGVGRPGRGLQGMQACYREAVRAYQLGPNIWPERTVFSFDELGVYRLLGSIADKNELQDFVKETVGPIVAYDREKGTELLKTLAVFFECRGNLKKVSEKMVTHYNTVLYRLERIKEIANVDLDDATACLNLQLGLKILKILEM